MSNVFGCTVVASAFVLAGVLGSSPAVAKDLKFPDYQAYDQAPSSFTTSWVAGSRFIQPFIGVEAGINSSNTSFDSVEPPFDISGVTGVAGFNGGIRFRPSEYAEFGFRAGVLWGIGSNSISHPEASPFFDYKFQDSWTAFYEATFSTDARLSERLRWGVSLGAAGTHRTVTGTTSDFSVTSSNTVTGLTASVGFAVPITQSVDLTGQFRYINVPSATFFVPGAVQIGGDQFIATAGMTWNFNR